MLIYANEWQEAITTEDKQGFIDEIISDGWTNEDGDLDFADDEDINFFFERYFEEFREEFVNKYWKEETKEDLEEAEEM